MKKSLATFGLVAACAACCAIPLAIPAVAALLASAGISMAFGWDTVVCGLMLAAAGVLFWRWRAQKAAAVAKAACSAPATAVGAAADGGCGCETVCKVDTAR